MNADIRFYVKLYSHDKHHIGIGLRCFFCDDELQGVPLTCPCGNTIAVHEAENLISSVISKAHTLTNPGWFRRLLNGIPKRSDST